MSLRDRSLRDRSLRDRSLLDRSAIRVTRPRVFGLVLVLVMLVGSVLVVGSALPAGDAWAAPVHPTTTTAPAPPTWQTAWTEPMDLPYSTAVDATVRDIAQIPVSGTAIEIRLSNAWSSTPTTFGAVTVGAAQNGAAIVPGSIVPVTFGGARAVTVPANGSVTSDPVAVTVQAGEPLAITVSVLGSATVSVHYCCAGQVDSYATANGGGDQTANPSAAGFTLADGNIRWLSAVTIAGSPALGTVVAFGDSITEGFANGGTGWPNVLRLRIAQLPASAQVSLVNEGITGNTLTVFPPGGSYAETSGGLPGVTRFGPDALDLPGVKDIVLLLGTNDIWFGAGGEGGAPIPPYGSATAIEQGMEALIARAHAAGVKIFGVTLLPRSSSTGVGGERPETWTAADQATLAAVNAWILGPGTGFDGVIDLSAVMGDVYNGACQPDLPFPPYYTPDNLHPNTAGQTAMADAVPTTLFGIPQAPQAPPTIVATPTPGCPGAIQAEQALAAGRAVPASTPVPTTQPVPTTRPPAARPRATRQAGHSGGLPIGALVAISAFVLILVIASIVVLWRRAARRRFRHRRSRGAPAPAPTPRATSLVDRGRRP